MCRLFRAICLPGPKHRAQSRTSNNSLPFVSVPQAGKEDLHCCIGRFAAHIVRCIAASLQPVYCLAVGEDHERF